MPGESLILINPRRRRRRKNARSRRRMPAALRRYWAGKRGTRLANPRRRRKRRRNPVVHSYRRRYPIRARRRNPRSRRRSRMFRRLRNPRGDFMGTLGAAAIGAVGAIGLNVAYGYVSPYLPTGLQTGLAQSAVLGVGALGLGYLVGRFVSKEIGEDVAFGGLTVVMFNAASSLANSAGLPVPTTMAGYGDYTPRRLGAYLPGRPGTTGFGAYMVGRPATSGFRNTGLGYVSPAPVVRGLGAYMRPAPMNVAGNGGNWGDGM
jgi:hypothetical protein